MEELMLRCNNYFYRFRESGAYVISSNKIIGVRGKYAVGQYIRIINSILNDGVYKITAIAENEITIEEGLNNEMFNGTICGLAVPSKFIDIVNKIKTYDNEHKTTDIVSESVTGYSYTRATNKDGKAMTGTDMYVDEWKQYRCNVNSIQVLKYVQEV